MNTMVIDTNAYANFKRGDPQLVEEFAKAQEILMPIPVLAELRVGFAGGNKEAQNLLELEQFLSSPRVTVCPLGEQSTIHYAAIFGNLKRKGQPIPLNDVWIAATTMEHGAILVTADKHFRYIDGLLLKNT